MCKNSNEKQKISSRRKGRNIWDDKTKCSEWKRKMLHHRCVVEQKGEKHGRWKFLFRTKQSACHKDRNRRHESREQGVSPHGISYAWCRIRGLIAPPHNVNIPRQLTTVQRTRTRVNETGHSVIYGNASVSSRSLSVSISLSHWNPRYRPQWIFANRPFYSLPAKRIWANSVI